MNDNYELWIFVIAPISIVVFMLLYLKIQHVFLRNLFITFWGICHLASLFILDIFVKDIGHKIGFLSSMYLAVVGCMLSIIPFISGDESEDYHAD